MTFKEAVRSRRGEKRGSKKSQRLKVRLFRRYKERESRYKRLRRFQRENRATAKVLEAIAADLERGSVRWQKYADRVRGCGRYVLVKTCQCCQYMGSFHGSRECGFKLCMFYQQKASSKKRRKIEKLVGVMKKPRFATFTVKHGREDSLQATLGKLNKGWQKLLRRKEWKHHVDGGVSSLEVTWHQDNGWHPHLHVVFDGVYFPQKKLRALWHEVTGDSYVVDVRAVDEGVISEMSKYLSKPSSLLYEFERHGKQYLMKTDDQGEPVPLPFETQKGITKEFIETMHRRRTLKVFGNLKGKLKELEELEELEEPEEEQCPNCQIDIFLQVVMPIDRALDLYKAQEQLELEIRGPPGGKAA